MERYLGQCHGHPHHVFQIAGCRWYCAGEGCCLGHWACELDDSKACWRTVCENVIWLGMLRPNHKDCTNDDRCQPLVRAPKTSIVERIEGRGPVYGLEGC